jgi:hypothetical protein
MPACARSGQKTSLRSSSFDVCTQFLSGGDNSFDDIRVTSAAADLTAELVAYRFWIGMGYAKQNISRHNKHSGRAETTLQGMTFMEVSPQHLHDVVGVETFERLHRSAIAHDCETQARSRCLAVDHDRAGTARSVLAAKVSCCQAAIIPQEICKRLPRLDIACELGAVQLYRDRFHWLRISRMARKIVEVCRRPK